MECPVRSRSRGGGDRRRASRSTLIPIDAAAQVIIDEDLVGAASQTGERVARIRRSNCCARCGRPQAGTVRRREAAPLNDPLATMVAAYPGLAQTVPARVDIELAGRQPMGGRWSISRDRSGLAANCEVVVAHRRAAALAAFLAALRTASRVLRQASIKDDEAEKPRLIAGRILDDAQHPSEGLRQLHHHRIRRRGAWLRDGAAGRRLGRRTISPRTSRRGTFPRRRRRSPPIDCVILSDIGANTLLLHPDTFARFARRCRTGSTRCATTWRPAAGSIMVGGYMTFQGIDGKAQLCRHPGRGGAAGDAAAARRPLRSAAGRLPPVCRPGPPDRGRQRVAVAGLLGYNRVHAKPRCPLVASRSAAIR